MQKQILLSASFLILTLGACAQSKNVGEADNSLSAYLKKQEQERVARNELFIKEKGIPRHKTDVNGTPMFLHHVDKNGKPVYYKSYSNLQQAQNLKSARLWQGGGLGLNLHGQDMEISTAAARLGIWEPEAVRTTHLEFGGRATTRDTPAFTMSNSNTDHATHVAGTMIATGLRANAHGQANKAKIDCYETQTDEMEEMEAAAAVGMLVSNHSYGSFYDTTGELQGTYKDFNALYDTIVYIHPYYLPLFAAGNDRAESIGRKYRLVAGPATSKNILTIAASELIDSPGYVSPASVKATFFTSYGPTNDGRVKPDLTAPGLYIYSSISQSDTSYDTYSGTSMASPGAAGALFLLQQHYKNTRNGAFMRAATLKGLAIHTAEEAGPTGPDAMFGWGFINAEKAVEQLNDSTSSHYMEQSSLVQGGTYTKNFTSNGTPLRATICWTDLPGIPTDDGIINDPTPKLVNDLDLRIIYLATGQVITRLPWKLNAMNPGDSATRGDNIVDNVEQIDIPNLPAGNYALRVTHKGILQNGTQDFSIFLTGGATVAGIRNTPEFAKNAVLFPNPTNDGSVKVRFSTVQQRVSVRVLNILGQEIYRGTESNTTEISLKINGAAGLYTVEVRNAQEELAAYMVTKQ